MSSSPEAPASSARGTFWAFVPVGLLGASLLGVGVMCSIAVHDPGFALETNYYERAVRWDGQQAQWAENSRLGYHIALSSRPVMRDTELVTRVLDREGSPVRGARVSVEAFANARSADRRALTLTEGADGTYAALLERARPGLWELRFSVERDGVRFTETVRTDVPPRSLP